MMAEEKGAQDKEPAKTGEPAQEKGGDSKPAGVGPVDKKPEIEQQPT